MTIAHIDPAALRARIVGEGELALLDVRERPAYARSHILLAGCLPLGRLELEIAARVPRRDTPVVVCDGGEGLAERAARRLGELGYPDVAVLAGGTPAWGAAGHELFSGVHVASKAFGELVEHACATPSVSAAELKALIDRGEDLVILDSRPMPEYRAFCIPGGVCVPGAELVYRVHDLAPDPDTVVVVNCAGRTRSIIGAQSLINAGIPNRVVDLRNGTMDWHLAGYELEHGMMRTYRDASPAGLAAARAAAQRVAARFGVPRIDAETLARWQAEAGQRTLYVFDVRSPAEFEAGHRPGSRSAPGGQLVQETDAYAGTLRARVVLVDDDGVRATMTASWLRQMGWHDTHVLVGGLEGVELERGPARARVLGLPAAPPPVVSPRELADMLAAGSATVIDLTTARAYRAGHVPGAAYALRSRLDASLPALAGDGALVLTSEDGVLATLAAPEAAALGRRPVRVLDGGTAAWMAAGMETASGPERMLDEPDDVGLRARPAGRSMEDAMRDYLEWETDLVERVERDGTARFEVMR